MKPERGHILVVEDDAPIRQLLCLYLTNFGFRVTECSTGEDALAYYQDHQADVDLVSLDLSLPGISGLMCFRAMKKANPGVRAVVLTGYIPHEDMSEALESGILAVFNKPVDFLELRRRFGNFVEA